MLGDLPNLDHAQNSTQKKRCPVLGELSFDKPPNLRKFACDPCVCIAPDVKRKKKGRIKGTPLTVNTNIISGFELRKSIFHP